MYHETGSDKVKFVKINEIKMAIDIDNLSNHIYYIHKDNIMDMIGLDKSNENNWEFFHELLRKSYLESANIYNRIKDINKEYIKIGIESNEQAKNLDKFEKKYKETHKDDEDNEIWNQDQLPIELRYYDYINEKIAYLMLLNANTVKSQEFKTAIALKVYPTYTKFFGSVEIKPSDMIPYKSIYLKDYKNLITENY